MTFRTRIGRLVIAAIALAVALGLLAPIAASAEPPRAAAVVHEDATPAPHPGYELAEVPTLAEVQAAYYRALRREAEIRRDLCEVPARDRVARSGRTVFALYDTD